MTASLTSFQKKLCNALQRGLPVSAQPFAQIAESLGRTEMDVLRETRALKAAGLIRRLSATLNQRALGMASTLVTAHVPQETLEAVAQAVNRLSGVSHNYLREHRYNLWFTLQEATPDRLHATLLDLGKQFGVDFHSLPVTRVFKLDVRFDLECDEDVLEHDRYDVPGSEPVELRPEHKHVLSRLRDDLEITSRPFDHLHTAELGENEVLRLLTELHDLGVIRRIAAVMNHRKLGYAANVMFAAEVPPEAVVEAGRRLARFRAVSHCYERETFEGWPYNLFAMMHARRMDPIRRAVAGFTKQGDVRSYEMLSTKAELKKQPVRHEFL